MGEHSKSKSEYESFDRLLRSDVPRLNLPGRDVDDIMAGEFVDTSVTMESRDDYADDHPEILDVNQFEWELNLLAKQNPEHAANLAAALLSSGLGGNAYAASLGANITVRLIGVDRQRASDLIADALQYEISARAVSRALSESIEAGLIASVDAAYLVSSFAWKIHEGNGNQAIREKENSLAGRIAADVKYHSNFSGASHVVVGNDTAQINIFRQGR